ncbi:MAG: hypothetical protein IJU18_01270, partial [Oscillospiraceae bacterium]|nr:hypothetical protein [Oscillospiraceae bacterium]
MRKLKRAAALVLALVMAVSLFMSAGRLVTVAEAESASISTAYPEATELLTNLGIMNNAEKTWAEAITAEEANSIIKTAFFDAPFNPYNWGYSTAIPEGTVTGAAFLQSIINSSGVGWNADAASWTTYFHLTRGIPGYDASASLSREQAAQLLVNCMKAQPNYTSSSEVRGVMMGVNYVKVSTDEMGRPSYQWVRTADGSALTAVYADAPLAVVSGNVTWNELMNSVGYTAALESALGAYMERMFNCTITEQGAASGTYLCKWPGNESGVVSLASNTIEIYDTYAFVGAVLPLNGVTFTARAYELIVSKNVSQTYPEATELMTNLGLMDSSAKAWTDPITVDEANALINAAFFVAPFNPYNWSYTDTIPAGDTVTGAQFLHSALSGMGWGTDEVWITYFHLTRGIEGYNASAALSREQAAQIMDNCMKAAAGYNATEIRGAMM